MCWLVLVGYPEKEDEQRYSSATIFNEEGVMVAKYRRVLFSIDKTRASKGECFPNDSIPRLGHTVVGTSIDIKSVVPILPTL